MRSKPRHAPKERPPDPHAADSNWRLFIAIPIPPAAQTLIATLTEMLDAGSPPVRWTATGSAHLTLHFLGEVDPARAELLRLSFSSIAGPQAGFDLTTDRLGCFPDEGPPRVVWLGLSGDTRELTSFHRALGLSLRKIAIESEDRSFRPHVTLGRIRDDASNPAAEALRTRILEPAINQLCYDDFATIPVHQIQLVRSYLERTGTRHEVIAVSNLRLVD